MRVASCSAVSRFAGTAFDDIWNGCQAPITKFTQGDFSPPGRALQQGMVKRIDGAWDQCGERRGCGEGRDAG